MSIRFYATSVSNLLTAKRPKLALILTAAFAIQLVAEPSSASTCRSFFLNEPLPPIARTLPDETPKIHTMNMREVYTALDLRRGTLEMERLNPHPSIDLLCTNFRVCFRIVSETPAGGHALKLFIRDSDGNKFNVMAEPAGASYAHIPFAAPPRNYLRVYMHQRESVPEPKVDIEGRRAVLREYFEKEGWENLSLNELSKRLANHQLYRSTNRRRARNIIEYDSGIREANALIAKRLLEKKDLTESDLIELNKLVLKGIDPFQDSYFRPLAGVLRGSFDQVAIEDGHLFVVDMRERQAFQMLATPSERVILLTFAPADQVSTLVQGLLKEVSQVSESTPLEKIFSIYQDFIKIHPFTDGNGRVSRLLLNFMLLKAKVPLPMRSPESLYFSPKELARDYTEGLLGRPEQ